MNELVGLRGQHHKIYDLGNGKRAAIVQNGLHCKDWDTGLWESPDLSFETSPTSGFTHRVKRSGVRWEVGSGNGNRRFYPVRGDTTKYYQFGNGGLSMTGGTVSGNTVTWSKAAFDLKMTATPEGMKFNLVLKNSSLGGAGAVKSFSFPLTLAGGLTFNTTDFCIYDGTKAVAEITKGYAYDSSATPVYKNLTTTYAGGNITMSLDTTGMVYPIYVDPSTGTIQPASKDNYMYKGGTGDDYSSATNLTTYSLSAYICRILMRFDFSSLGIAINDEITTATLSMNCYTASGGARTYLIDKVLKIYGERWGAYNKSSWRWHDLYSEWNSWGCGTAGTDYSTDYRESNTTGSSTGWDNFSVKTLANDAVADSSILDIVIRDNNETDGAYRYYRSSEYTGDTSLRPKLYLEWGAGGTTQQMAATFDGVATTSGAIGIIKQASAAIVAAAALSAGMARVSIKTLAVNIGASSTALATMAATRAMAATSAASAGLGAAITRTRTMAAGIAASATTTAGMYRKAVLSIAMATASNIIAVTTAIRGLAAAAIAGVAAVATMSKLSYHKGRGDMSAGSMINGSQKTAANTDIRTTKTANKIAGKGRPC